MTPVRALVISVMWVGVGLFLRFRFRILGCDESEGGWALAAYFFASAAVFVWLNLRDGDAGDDNEIVYRFLSRLGGLAVLVLVLSACLPYSSAHRACSS